MANYTDQRFSTRLGLILSVLGIAVGTEVCISPSDYAEAQVTGTLTGTTVSTVTIRREDPRVGEVGVHFPKIGYTVEPI